MDYKFVRISQKVYQKDKGLENRNKRIIKLESHQECSHLIRERKKKGREIGRKNDLDRRREGGKKKQKKNREKGRKNNYLK